MQLGDASKNLNTLRDPTGAGAAPHLVILWLQLLY